MTDPRPQRSRIDAIQIVDSGNAKLLAKVTEPLLAPLKFAFPNDYSEIIELAFTRCLGRGELNKTRRCWKGIEDVFKLRPNTSPKSLSKTLEHVSLGRGSQNMFFNRIRMDEGEMAIDMSVIFSKSRGSVMLKTGYNRFRSSCPQFNLLMGCSISSGRPQYMKVLPGNVKEGSAVSMLDEFDIPEGTVLVMDRGYSDKTLLTQIEETDLEFIVAVRRNSDMYKVTDTSEGMFR